MPEKIFTAPNAWLNGFYQLVINLVERSDERSRDALIALKSAPLLDAWYLERDKEPADQPRVNAGGDIKDHRYGVLTLPNAEKVACGCFIYHQEYAPDWLELYIPLGSLDKIYPTGAFPFGASEGYTEWEREVDAALVELARHVHKSVPFPAGIIGFEPRLDDMEALYRSSVIGVPPEGLWNGFLWTGKASKEELEWHPPKQAPRY